jgi:hypothetical protein
MSLTMTPRLADRRRQPGGGSLTARSAGLSPRSPPLSSRTAADVRCELRGGGMAGMDQRHNEIKKRSMLVERTPHLLHRFHELSGKAKNMPQWVANSCGVPDKWRQQALELVDSIHMDVLACRHELTQVWQLLQPPLDAFGLEEYERRYYRLERVLVALERALVNIEEKFLHGEQWAACKLIQLWFRRYLTRVRLLPLLKLWRGREVCTHRYDLGGWLTGAAWVLHQEAAYQPSPSWSDPGYLRLHSGEVQTHRQPQDRRCHARISRICAGGWIHGVASSTIAVKLE